MFLEYLQRMKTTRRSPWEFCVVFNDYTHIYIQDIHEFYLETLRKPIVGVAIHIPGEQWKVWLVNPYGGTIERLMWKREQAVHYISYRHSQLSARYEREHNPTPKETGLSDAGKTYANPIP